MQWRAVQISFRIGSFLFHFHIVHWVWRLQYWGGEVLLFLLSSNLQLIATLLSCYLRFWGRYHKTYLQIFDEAGNVGFIGNSILHVFVNIWFFVEQQSEPIFDRIFRSTIELLCYVWPFLSNREEFLEQYNVFRRLPRPLLYSRVQIASPPLPTMLRRSVQLHLLPNVVVELFRYFKPRLCAKPFDDIFQKDFFALLPIFLLGRFAIVSEAHPLEHGLFMVLARDEICNCLPIFLILNYSLVTNSSGCFPYLSSSQARMMISSLLQFFLIFLLTCILHRK